MYAGKMFNNSFLGVIPNVATITNFVAIEENWATDY